MRRAFFKELHKLMAKDKNIIALTGDLGYGGFDPIAKDYPDRYINCGAAEFSMVAMACGLAHSGKIPVVYSITPFLVYRPFEVLRTYINHEKIPVKLFGSGRDGDYKHDGISHDATDTWDILKPLQNIRQCYPIYAEDIPSVLKEVLYNPAPYFVSLCR